MKGEETKTKSRAEMRSSSLCSTTVHGETEQEIKESESVRRLKICSIRTRLCPETILQMKSQKLFDAS